MLDFAGEAEKCLHERNVLVLDEIVPFTLEMFMFFRIDVQDHIPGNRIRNLLGVFFECESVPLEHAWLHIDCYRHLAIECFLAAAAWARFARQLARAFALAAVDRHSMVKPCVLACLRPRVFCVGRSPELFARRLSSAFA